MEFIKALEEEKKKIVVFERELPLSLVLISQAIETFKQQLDIYVNENSTSEVPVVEEFIPLRLSNSYSSNEETNNKTINNSTIKINGGTDNIPNWLRSAQLWNEQPEPRVESVKKPEAAKAGGAFHPLEKEKASSTNNDNGFGGCQSDGSHQEIKEGNPNRKARKRWSSELHHRFLNALQEIGGPLVATPKVIRDIMKVDHLTNGEIKSHLQKYRLYGTRQKNNCSHQPQRVSVHERQSQEVCCNVEVSLSLGKQ